MQKHSTDQNTPIFHFNQNNEEDMVVFIKQKKPTSEA